MKKQNKKKYFFLLTLFFFMGLLALPLSFVPSVKANPDSGDWQVAASADDAKKRFLNGVWNFSITAKAADVGWDNINNHAAGSAFRFNNISIPQGSTITNAYLNMCAYLTRSATVVRSKLQCEAADDAAEFSDLANFDARSWTAAVTYDGVPAWTLDSWYQSVNISSCVQAVVNREGWESNNSLVVVWQDFENRSDTGEDTNRAGTFYDKGNGLYTRLHVEWTPPSWDPSQWLYKKQYFFLFCFFTQFFVPNLYFHQRYFLLPLSTRKGDRNNQPPEFYCWF